MSKASSFADPKDVSAYRKWFAIFKDEGMSDEEAMGHAFAKGDNGVGCWGDDTTEGSGPSCAIPPEYMRAKFGGTFKARLEEVAVTIAGETHNVPIKDVMPHIRNITNGARIDLNPDAGKLFNLTPPFLVNATWEWVS